jgi:phosphohistidine swiveling domain-containing protein
MVATELLTQSEYADFMNSLNTVSTRMTRDFSSLSRETFLAIYGHLRPGTYDILSARYDEEPDTYFEWKTGSQEPKGESFRLSLEQYKKIEEQLKAHGLEIDVLSLFDFLKSAIEGREYAKFLFTRNVSDALSLIKSLGSRYGFQADDLSYLDILTVLRLYSSSIDPAVAIAGSIESGRKAHRLTRSLTLPSLIFKASDIFAFHLLDSEPNYVTHLQVESDVVFVNSTQDLPGKIVFIENADPGFDWIFTKGISGFVTMYGGANSHMAIRAGEMKIPAVVGAGEANFARWSKAKRLAIDCCNRQVRVLS